MKGKLKFHDYVQLECEIESVTSSWIPTQEETGKPKIESLADPEFAFVRERPDTHMVFSVMTSLFCCLPVGLLALLLSRKVKQQYEEGDIKGAHRSSITSLRLNHSACIIGLVFWIVGIFCIFMYIASE